MTKQKRKLNLGIESKVSLVIGAENPQGSRRLLAEHIGEVVKKYLARKNKICYVNQFYGVPMQIQELKEGSLSKGNPYLLTIKLQEIYRRAK